MWCDELKPSVRVHTGASALAMGSLPDDAVHAYCGINPAGYKPEGTAGALCFWLTVDSCWDLFVQHGWEAVMHIRL